MFEEDTSPTLVNHSSPLLGMRNQKEVHGKSIMENSENYIFQILRKATTCLEISNIRIGIHEVK